MGALWAAGSSQQAPVWVSWALGNVWFSLRITPCHSRQRRGIDAGLQVKPEGRLTGLCVTVTNNPKLHGLKQHLLSPILLRRESECGSAGGPRRWVSHRPDHGVGLGCSQSQAPWVQACSSERPPSVPSRRGRSMGQLRTRQPAPSEGTSEKSQRGRTNRTGLTILHSLTSEETSHHAHHVLFV